MIAINMSACSGSFRIAFEAIKAGGKARRNSWPEGQYLQEIPDGRIAVFRNNVLSSPFWSGPSSAEMDADDWVLVTL